MYNGGPPPQAYLQSMQAAARQEESKKPPDPNKPVAEAVNKTGGVQTDDGRTLFGLDAEIYLKLKAKEDPDWERKIGAWIETVYGKPLIDVADLHTSLKDGVILCELLNILKPGTVKKINPTTGMLRHLAERDNIQLYLKGCYTLGIDNSSMFTIADLHARRGIANVLSNIAALSQLAYQKLGCKVEPLGPAMASTEADGVPQSQRTFKWNVDTSHLTKVMAGEAVSEGVSDLENSLKEAKIKLEACTDKFRLLERDRNLVLKCIDREKMKARDADQHVHHLRSNNPTINDYLQILQTKKTTFENDVATLQQKAESQSMVEKLMNDLKTMEGTFDQEEEDHRTTMNSLTARSTELAEKANYMRNTIEDGAANREELNSQIASATSQLTAESSAVQSLEAKHRDSATSFAEEQKNMKVQLDSLQTRQQSIVTEAETIKNKLAADLESFLQQSATKKKALQDKIGEVEHKKRTFTERTQEEREGILEELQTQIRDGQAKAQALETQKADLETEKATTLGNLTSQIEKLESEKTARQERKEQRVAEATKELEAMKASCGEQEQKVMKQLKEAQEKLKVEMAAQQQEMQALNEQLTELRNTFKNEKNSAQTEVEKVSREIAQIKKNVEKLQSDAKTQIESLTASHENVLVGLRRDAEAISKEKSKIEDDASAYKVATQKKMQQIDDQIELENQTSKTQLESIAQAMVEMRSKFQFEIDRETAQHAEIVEVYKAEIAEQAIVVDELNLKYDALDIQASSETFQMQKEVQEIEYEIRLLGNEIDQKTKERERVKAAFQSEMSEIERQKANVEKQLLQSEQSFAQSSKDREEDFQQALAQLQQEAASVEEAVAARLAKQKKALADLEGELLSCSDVFDAEINEVNASTQDVRDKYEARIAEEKARYDDLMEEQTELQSENQESREFYDAKLEEEKSNLIESETELSRTHADLQEELAKLKETHEQSMAFLRNEIEEQKKRASHEIAEYEEQMAALREKQSDRRYAYENEREEISRETLVQKSAVDEIRAELAYLQEEGEQQLEQCGREREYIEMGHSEQMETLEAEALRLNTLKNALEEQNEAVNADIAFNSEKFEAEIASIDEQIQESSKGKETEDKLAHQKKVLNHLQSMLAKYQQDAAEIKNRKKEGAMALVEVMKELKVLSNETNTMQGRVKNLRAKLEETDMENARLDEEILVLQRPKNRGVVEEEEVQEETKEQKAKKQHEEIVAIQQKEIVDVVHKCLSTNIEWSTQTAQKLLPYQEIFKEESGRRTFTTLLLEAMHDKLLVLPGGSFDALLFLVSLCLGKLNLETGADNISAQYLFESCQLIKKKDSGEIATEYIKKNRLWDNMDFWEQYFWTSMVPLFQQQFGNLESETYTPEQRKFLIERIGKFVFGLWGWGKESSPQSLGLLAMKLGDTIEVTESERAQLRNIEKELVVIDQHEQQQKSALVGLSNNNSPSASSTALSADKKRSFQSGHLSPVDNSKEKEKKGKKEGGLFGGMFGEKEKKNKKDKRGSEKEKSQANQPEPCLGVYYCIEEYSSTQATNLSYVIGDRCIVFQKYPTGWYKGVIQRTGQTGLVHPSKIVELFYEDEVQMLVTIADVQELDRSRLSYKKGDKIKITNQTLNPNTWSGSVVNTNVSGLFNCTNTVPLDSVLGEAKEDYDTKTSGMLPFKKGDQIIIMQKNKTGQWKGYANGKTGIFPSNKIAVLEPSTNTNTNTTIPKVRSQFTLPQIPTQNPEKAEKKDFAFRRALTDRTDRK